MSVSVVDMSLQGDTGSPLVSRQGSKWIQSGIAVYSIGCGLPEYPAVYVRVSEYQDWISYYTNSSMPGFVPFPLFFLSEMEARSSSHFPLLSHFPSSLSSSYTFKDCHEFYGYSSVMIMTVCYTHWWKVFLFMIKKNFHIDSVIINLFIMKHKKLWHISILWKKITFTDKIHYNCTAFHFFNTILLK